MRSGRGEGQIRDSILLNKRQPRSQWKVCAQIANISGLSPRLYWEDLLRQKDLQGDQSIVKWRTSTSRENRYVLCWPSCHASCLNGKNRVRDSYDSVPRKSRYIILWQPKRIKEPGIDSRGALDKKSGIPWHRVTCIVPRRSLAL